MSPTRDTLALVLSWVALIFSALALVLALGIGGWWALLVTPALAGILFGLVGVTTYRPGRA